MLRAVPSWSEPLVEKLCWYRCCCWSSTWRLWFFGLCALAHACFGPQTAVHAAVVLLMAARQDKHGACTTRQGRAWAAVAGMCQPQAAISGTCLPCGTGPGGLRSRYTVLKLVMRMGMCLRLALLWARRMPSRGASVRWRGSSRQLGCGSTQKHAPVVASAAKITPFRAENNEQWSAAAQFESFW